MLNRRHLRIKVLQALYAFYQADAGSIPVAEKAMFSSINKIWYLYVSFLAFFNALMREAERRIEDGKQKKLPSESDLSPGLNFVNNPALRRLADSKVIDREVEKAAVDRAELHELAKKVFDEVVKGELYAEHMAQSEVSFEESRIFVARLFKKFIANSETIQSHLEDSSIQWVDDIDLVCNAVLKTVKKMPAEKNDVDLMPFYKDTKDDKKFVSGLFKETIALNEENEKHIDEHTSNWELDRIAFMDMLLMKMAITEVQNFSTIPVKVTLNEYIEISKFYSTPKSNTFINGILDKLFTALKDSGKIKKMGRGLIEH